MELLGRLFGDLLLALMALGFGMGYLIGLWKIPAEIKECVKSAREAEGLEIPFMWMMVVFLIGAYTAYLVLPVMVYRFVTGGWKG